MEKSRIIKTEYIDRTEYTLNGVLHNEGGPALYSKGIGVWYRNGVIHREDGPAIHDGMCDGLWFHEGKPMPSEMRLLIEQQRQIKITNGRAKAAREQARKEYRASLKAASQVKIEEQ